jgi:hypothetical protein
LREFYRKVNVYETILDKTSTFVLPKEDPICLKENAILYQKLRKLSKQPLLN